VTASAYHLFEDLYQRRRNLAKQSIKADKLALKDALVACVGGRGKFPDMVLRVNHGDPDFSGGELIEIKDAETSYNIAPFNSTIPTGVKRMAEVAKRGGGLYNKLQKTEGDPHKNPLREVYYLIRGMKNGRTKVCLVHGLFFETITVDENIKGTVAQAVAEAAQDSHGLDDAALQQASKTIAALNWKQEHMSKTRITPGAAVGIRYRTMAGAVADANILNRGKYPQIKDDTLNMIVPAHTSAQGAAADAKSAQTALMEKAFEVGKGKLPTNISVFEMKHLLNGPFVVFQAPL